MSHSYKVGGGEKVGVATTVHVPMSVPNTAVPRTGGLLDSSRVAAADTAFLQSLASWQAEPVRLERENRTEAALLIRMCSEEGLTSIDLSYLGLSSLPDALWAVDRPGTPCFAAGGLQELRLNDNRLSQLPAAIGELRQLRRLSLSANQLSALPAEIGKLSQLRSLRLADNDLGMLPHTIFQLTLLESLSADGCLLTTLPAALSDLSALRHLDLEDNLLTSLPRTASCLSSDCLVRLFMNPLPERVRDALRDARGGPVFLVDDGPTGRPVGGGAEAPSLLADAVFPWLIESADRSGAALTRWQILGAQPHADALVTLLQRLMQAPDARNWNTQAAFRMRVCTLLEAIASRASLATLCMQAARDAHAADTPWEESLEKLEALVIDDDAQRGGWSLAEILTLALQRFRLKALNDLVAEHMIGWPFADTPDVRLAYRAALAGQWRISDDKVPDVRDHALLEISEDDIARAAQRLADVQSESSIVDFLIDYAPWRAGLCRAMSTVFEALLRRFDVERDVLLETTLASSESDHVVAASPAQLTERRRMQTRQQNEFADILRAQTRVQLKSAR